MGPGTVPVDSRLAGRSGGPGLGAYRQALQDLELIRRIGWVRQVQGLAIQAQGPDATVGELCRIRPRLAARGPQAQGSANEPSSENTGVLAEVVGLHAGHVTLLPYGSLQGVSAGAEVLALGRASMFGVGPAQIGRVIDGFGEPLDGGARPAKVRGVPLHGAPVNPMWQDFWRHLANANTIQGADGPQYRPLRVVARAAAMAASGSPAFADLFSQGVGSGGSVAGPTVVSVEPTDLPPRMSKPMST